MLNRLGILLVFYLLEGIFGKQPSVSQQTTIHQTITLTTDG